MVHIVRGLYTIIMLFNVHSSSWSWSWLCTVSQTSSRNNQPLVHDVQAARLTEVVGILGVETQKNRPGVTAGRLAIVWPYVSIVCARPYVSIMRRWAICFYWLAVGVGLGHMFVLVGCGRGARPYVSIVCVYVYMYVCICVCMCVCMCVCVYVCV